MSSIISGAISGIFGWLADNISGDKYWTWKQIVEYMQILKDNNAAQNDCGFNNLFLEWDGFIMADKYGWLKIGDSYVMVSYKRDKQKIIATVYLEKLLEIEGIFGLGSVGSEEWSYVDEEIEIDEDQIYFGVFSPINKLCHPIKVTNISVDENTRIRQPFLVESIKTEFITFFLSTLKYAELFFEKVLFYIRINKLKTLKNIESKPSKPSLKF
jgi:hypothetical protein